MCHNCASMVRLWSILLDGDLKGFKFISVFVSFPFCSSQLVWLLLFLYCWPNLDIGKMCEHVICGKPNRQKVAWACNLCTHRNGTVSLMERRKLCNYTKTIPKEDCPLGVHY